MAQQRSTFAKLQRERDKKEKAAAKADRRAQQSTTVADVSTVQKPDPDNEAKILAGLAALHAAYEEGTISIDEFEDRRDQLRERLQIS